MDRRIDVLRGAGLSTPRHPDAASAASNQGMRNSNTSIQSQSCPLIVAWITSSPSATKLPASSRILGMDNYISPNLFFLNTAIL